MRFTNDDIIGCFAFSLAGHDKGNLYIVVGTFEDYVYLSDGKLKKAGSPKKKKLKHIQLVKRHKVNAENLTDSDIKRAIKIFLKEEKEAN